VYPLQPLRVELSLSYSETHKPMLGNELRSIALVGMASVWSRKVLY